MKRAILPAIALIMAVGTGAESAKAANYATMMARHCHLQSNDIAKRFFQDNLRMHRQTIVIRRVVPAGGGWLRVHAAGNTRGRHTWGFASFNTRTGAFICDPNNWHVDPSPNDRNGYIPRLRR